MLIINGNVTGGQITTANGRVINTGGRPIEIRNDRMYVGGVPIEEYDEAALPVIKISVQGSVDTLTMDCGEVTVKGNVGSITSRNGSIYCENVEGNVENRNGSITCKTIHGDVIHKNGNVTREY